MSDWPPVESMPGVARHRPTISFTDLPVSQGARDLWFEVAAVHTADDALTVLAAADEKDVRNLLWARRVGKL